ncbi:MAG TPA: hypothetical protein VHN39_00795 [Phenylobacterium sp.]|nr:hypothetical protein [Phenylobacterium sp.]
MTDAELKLPADDANDSAVDDNAVDDSGLDQVVGGTKSVDASSPVLYTKCATGTHSG